MTGAGDLARMVPGFDFLQSLIKGAGAAVPGMGQWIAPTLDPEELDKRIGELDKLKNKPVILLRPGRSAASSTPCSGGVR